MKTRIARLLAALLILSLGLACAEDLMIPDFASYTDEQLLATLDALIEEADTRDLPYTIHDIVFPRETGDTFEELEEKPKSKSKSTGSSADPFYIPAEPGGGVWIPRTGAKYHDNPNCCNMIDPVEVTVETAKSYGYEPCGKCKPIH